MRQITRILPLLFLLALPVAASACPGCRDALASAESADGTPSDGFGVAGMAYSASVLFLLALPLSGVGGLFWFVLRGQTTDRTQPVGP